MKKLRFILIAVPVVIGVGLLVLLWRLDGLVRSTVESQASTQLGVPARLESANVGLFSGVVALNEFALGSPPGFDAPRMFELAEVNVSAGYRQLAGKPIRVRSVVIDRPKLVIEQKNLKLNVQALIDQMPPNEAPPDQPSEPIRVIIDELKINGASVVIHPGIPGLDEQLTLNIDPISVREIGTADGARNGAAVREVALTVIDALAKAAARSDRVPPQVRDLLTLDVQQMVRARMEDAQHEIGRAVEQIVNDPTRARDVGKQLEKGLKDAIGGKKDGRKD